MCTFSMLLSQSAPPSPSPTVSMSVFSTSPSPGCPANRFISMIFLDSIYMY